MAAGSAFRHDAPSAKAGGQGLPLGRLLSTVPQELLDELAPKVVEVDGAGIGWRREHAKL